MKEKFKELEVMVEIAKLTYHPFSVETYCNRENYDVERLMNSIFPIDGKENLKHPITISSRYEVLDGIMRVKAYKCKGKTLIRARIIDVKEEDEKEFVLASNQYRLKSEQEMMKETLAIYKSIVRHQGQKLPGSALTPKEKAIKMSGADFSPRSFQTYLNVIKLDEENPSAGLLEAFENEEISISKAYQKGLEIKSRTEIKEKVANQKIVQMLPVEADDYRLFNKSNHDMPEIADESCDVSISSCPYFRQRTYGDDPNEIGRGTIPQYLDDLCKTYTEQFRVTKQTGSALVNLSETYQLKDAKGNLEHNLIPEKFVLMMRDIGWHKVKTCIWVKTTSNLVGNRERRPESIYEPFFWFVKDPEYYYQPIRIPHDRDIKIKMKAAGRKNQDGTKTKAKMLVTKAYDTFSDVISESDFMDVIRTNTASNESRLLNKYYGSHEAIFPIALPLLPILQCCPVGGTVIDPFVGSGTTMAAALLMGRKAIGYEIESESFNIAKSRLEDLVNEIDVVKADEVETLFKSKFDAAA